MLQLGNFIGRLWRFFRKCVRNVDPILLSCMLALSSLSLLTIIGGLEQFGRGRLIMQGGMVIIGLFVVLVIAQFDYQDVVDKLWLWFFVLSVALLLATLLFGLNINGNKSWLGIKHNGRVLISIQPSEFVKASFILTFAKHLQLVKGRINHWKSILSLMVHAGIIIGLILMTGDLGVALVYLCIVVVMLFCAGLSMWYFLGAAVAGVVTFPYLWPHLGEYRQKRILVGFNPESDPLGVGKQSLQGRDAIINGGLTGQGLRGGTVYKSLYAADTDFFFSTFCEKFGFIGAVLFLIIVIVFACRIVHLARVCRKDYGAYICAGVAGMMIAQILENVGMCMGVLPVVGITLPFMSCGGSSMLALYITFGMLHSIYSHRARLYQGNRVSTKTLSGSIPQL